MNLKNKNKRILITGASGYIGSCLNNFFYKNIQIYCLDKKPLNIWAKIEKKKFYVCNLLNKKKLTKIIKDIMPDVVIHFAATSTVNEKISYSKYYQNNVEATKNLIEVMNKLKIKKIIYSSTAAVYDKKKRKINEKDRLNPISKYGKSKLKAEEIIKKNRKIKHIILRFFNVSSSISKPIIGEYHNPETHLIPVAVSNASKNKTINLFGDDYPTKDGTCIRDYIHIKDICLAIQKSIIYLKNKNSKSLVLNIGNGKGISNKEIIFSLQKILKKKIDLRFLKRRRGDQAFLVCDIKKAKKLIKWNPKNSTTTKILKGEINWTKFLVKGFFKRKIMHVQK
jgi:UDP-glucose 4-epimerase